MLYRLMNPLFLGMDFVYFSTLFSHFLIFSNYCCANSCNCSLGGFSSSITITITPCPLPLKLHHRLWVPQRQEGLYFTACKAFGIVFFGSILLVVKTHFAEKLLFK